ncbi:MAG: phosphoribosyltransferase, partial [Oxalobacteraceae bacterium]
MTAWLTVIDASSAFSAGCSPVRYRSFVDLSQTVQNNLYRIPRDVDLVVGIPRSGLLPANMLALALNLPLADIDGFAEGRTLSAGHTRRRDLFDQSIDTFRRILVVDDSVRTGDSMREARQKLAHLPNQDRFLFCAIYADEDTHPDADLVMESVPTPRVFQWNFLHRQIAGQSCFDIDGVLCVDPTSDENDDGERYRAFL